MSTEEQAVNNEESASHTQRIEELKETLDKIIIDLDPSYGEVEDYEKYKELYVAILESTLVELNELDEDFD
ncbi:MAG: hypothetical protein V3S80_00690 [Sulfurimonadaceae bacterium]